MSRSNDIIVKEDYTILVVDDQEEVLDSARMLLELEGYKVICARDGDEAIREANDNKIDLILLDYFMPGKTGEDVVREIRKNNNEIFILLQTGYAGEKPPLELLKNLNIQGYHDKTEGPDKLLLWVAAGIRSCAQMRVNRQLREGLSNILDFVPHIFKTRAYSDLMEDILLYLSQLVKYDSAFVLIEEPGMQEPYIFGKGRFEDMQFNALMHGSKLYEVIEKAKGQDEIFSQDGNLVLPMLYDNKWIGYIYLEQLELNDQDKDLIRIYLHQVAEAMINIQLHDEVITSNEKLKESYFRLKKNNYELIESFTKAVDAKDAYTAGHSTRVSIYARILGRLLGMKRKELIRLKVAALFHDIGKIGIPDDVLLKDGKLTDEEYMVIKEHPLIGSKILSPVSMLAETLPAIRHHHERYDGRGYPDRLAGENIPLHARILSIADSFDAMTSNRSYQRKRSFEEALCELERCKGTHFDPKLTDMFVKQFRDNIKYYNRLVSFWDHIHHFDKLKDYRNPYSLGTGEQEQKLDQMAGNS